MKIVTANMVALAKFADAAKLEDAVRTALVEQFGGGKSWVALQGGKPASLFGLYEHRQDNLTLEAWFLCLPQVAPGMLKLVRGMRMLLRTEMSRMRPTVTYVMPGYAPGERLAKLLGFAATGEILDLPGTPVHGVQTWEYRP